MRNLHSLIYLNYGGFSYICKANIYTYYSSTINVGVFKNYKSIFNNPKYDLYLQKGVGYALISLLQKNLKFISYHHITHDSNTTPYTNSYTEGFNNKIKGLPKLLA